MLQVASGECIYSLLGGDPDLGDIVEMFVDEMPGRTATLLDQLNAGDWEGLQRTAHQLKGAAGSYGFGPILRSAAQVENAVRDGEPAERVARLSMNWSCCAAGLDAASRHEKLLVRHTHEAGLGAAGSLSARVPCTGRQAARGTRESWYVRRLLGSGCVPRRTPAAVLTSASANLRVALAHAAFDFRQQVALVPAGDFGRHDRRPEMDADHAQARPGPPARPGLKRPLDRHRQDRRARTGGQRGEPGTERADLAVLRPRPLGENQHHLARVSAA